MTASPARILVLATLAAALAGCGTGDTGGATPARRTNEPDGAAAAGPPMRGVLTAGTTASFLPCGAPGSRELAVTGPAAAEIARLAASFPGAKDGRFYVELRGTISVDGATIRASELVRARPPGEGASCERPVFDGDTLANGNEPFWSIEVRSDAIVYRSPDEARGRRFPYSAMRTSAGGFEYTTRIDRPRVSTLALAVTPGRCVDTMSGEIRSFTARAELDGKTLRGCAAAGVPHGGFGDDPLDELERFAGTYPDGAGLWSIEPIKSRLSALLGDKRTVFEANLQVKGPLMKDAGVYYVLGNKRHEGGTDAAVFLADPAGDTIEVILFEKGKRSEYKEGGRDVLTPPEVRTALESLSNP